MSAEGFTEGHIAAQLTEPQWLDWVDTAITRARQSDRMRRIAALMNNVEDDPEGQARAASSRSDRHGGGPA